MKKISINNQNFIITKSNTSNQYIILTSTYKRLNPIRFAIIEKAINYLNIFYK